MTDWTWRSTREARAGEGSQRGVSTRTTTRGVDVDVPISRVAPTRTEVRPRVARAEGRRARTPGVRVRGRAWPRGRPSGRAPDAVKADRWREGYSFWKRGVQFFIKKIGKGINEGGTGV